MKACAARFNQKETLKDSKQEEKMLCVILFFNSCHCKAKQQTVSESSIIFKTILIATTKNTRLVIFSSFIYRSFFVFKIVSLIKFNKNSLTTNNINIVVIANKFSVIYN
jgi:hypothetical protein